MDPQRENDNILETPRQSHESSRPLLLPPALPLPNHHIREVSVTNQFVSTSSDQWVDNEERNTNQSESLSFPFIGAESARIPVYGLGKSRRRSNSVDAAIPFPKISLRPRFHGRGSGTFKSNHTGEPGCTCIECLCGDVSPDGRRDSERHGLSRRSHFRSNTFGGFDSTSDVFAMAMEAEQPDNGLTTITYEHSPLELSSLSHNLPSASQAFIPATDTSDGPWRLSLSSRDPQPIRPTPRHLRPNIDISFLKSVPSQECLNLETHRQPSSSNHIRTNSNGTQSLTTASPQNTDTPDWGHHTLDDSPVIRNIQDSEQYLCKNENQINMKPNATSDETLLPFDEVHLHHHGDDVGQSNGKGTQ
jgi:hypothetical protein